MGKQEDELLNLLPNAEQTMEKISLERAKRAEQERKTLGRAGAEKKALIDKLSKPSGVSDAEAIKKATIIIQRAVKEGRTQVEVYRFPNELCTDRGRKINQQEAGWEGTLTGVPLEIYQFWKRHLREKGYRLVCEIVDFSGGVPGEVGMMLRWGK